MQIGNCDNITVFSLIPAVCVPEVSKVNAFFAQNIHSVPDVSNKCRISFMYLRLIAQSFSIYSFQPDNARKFHPSNYPQQIKFALRVTKENNHTGREVKRIRPNKQSVRLLYRFVKATQSQEHYNKTNSPNSPNYCCHNSQLSR
jgi:hypothetical protein